ncbi:MAG TPA: Calx-beta domain-containing protein, partial [Thermoanaerobaculia bacterium]|nr:Calx-beta domain-containing protein [Thermoanaerobaculia bacterium]
MRSNWSRCLSVLLLLILASTAAAATRTWTGTVDNSWSNPANWSPAGAPAITDTLVFPAGKSGTLTNDALGNLRSIQFEGGGYVLNGNALTLTHGVTQLNGTGTNQVFIPLTLGASQTFSCAAGSTLSFTKPVSYNGFTLTVDVASQGLLAFAATNSGNGAVVKNGSGVMSFSAAQNAAATINVSDGKVLIEAAFNVPVAITSPAVVELANDATFAGLTMTGGTVTTAFATNPPRKLTIVNPANMTSSATASAVITDNLEVSLGPGVTFNVTDGPQPDDFRIRSFCTALVTPTSLVKNGNGRMTLEDGTPGNTSFPGAVYVNDGQLSVRDVNALGTTSAPTYVDGGVLEIDAGNLLEPIVTRGGALGSTLSGGVDGPVQLEKDAGVVVGEGQTLFFNGPVAGAGRMLPSLPSLQTGIVLKNTNTFAGPISLAKGSLNVSGSQPNIDINLDGVLAGLSASGSVGIVTMTDGYLSMDTATTMVAKGLDLDGGTFTTATYNNTFTRCTVNGAVDLAGANFSIVVYSGFTPTPGQPYTIIANDGNDAIVPFNGIAEGSEVFTAGYRFRVSYAGGDGNDLTITSLPPAVTLEFPTYSIKEGQGPLNVGVRRVGGTSGPVSVTLQTYATNAQNQAAAGSDYQSQSVTVSWADGQYDTQYVAIPITADMQIENDEELGLRLVNPAGAVIGAFNNAPAKIVDDDSAAGFSSATYSVSEGAGSITFTFNRTGQGSAIPSATLQFDTIDGTATASSDFAPIQGQTINWGEGELGPKSISVTLLEDSTYEGDESFTVRISTVSPLDLGTSQATVTINDNDAPQRGTLAFQPQSVGVSENGGTVTLSVTRTGGSNGAVTVQYATVDGTAKSGTDYTAKSGLLSWGDGDSATKSVTIDILDDATNEPAEAFTVALSNPTGGPTLGSDATVSINDDDAPNQGTVQLSAGAYSALEGAGKITITANRTGGAQGEVMVKWSTSPGTAQPPNDYATNAVYFTWPDGDSSPKTADVTINDDKIKEGDETFTVSLSDPINGVTIGNPSQATLTILNDDVDGGQINVQGPVYAMENAGTLVFTVTRTGANEGAASVQFATSNETATAGSDYQAVTTTLNWADGDGTPRTVTINLLDDDAIENDESFRVTLTNVTGATPGVNLEAQGYIQNDDSAGYVELAATKYSVAENGGSVTLTVLRLGGKSGPATVDFATSDTSAIAGQDYTATSGTLTWAAGDNAPKTITIPILDDAVLEFEEQFTVTLSNATGAGQGNNSFASVHITNDDAPNPGKVQLDSSTYSVAENGAINVKVNRVGGNNGQVSVSIRVVFGTAGPNDLPVHDYLLVFADNSTDSYTVNINVWDDSQHEGPETFTLELYDPTGGVTLGTPNKATVTLTDDDSDTPGYVRLSSRTYNVSESAGSITIPVERVEGGLGQVSVNYRTQARTATAPDDFTMASGTLTWNAGEQGTKTFTVPIVNDTETENYEIVDIFLSDETGGVQTTFPNTAELVITDDDQGPAGDLRFASNTYKVNEGAGTVTATVNRVGGTSGAASVHYFTFGGSSLENSDYTKTTGTLNWGDGDGAGKSITVPIVDDNSVEGNEDFLIILDSPSGASLNPEYTTNVTIEDNDAPGKLTLAATTAIAVENQGSLTVTVKRVEGSKGAATVTYTATDGSAIQGVDYTATSGTLSWTDGDAADKSFNVPIINDTDVESVENFVVSIGAPTGASILQPSQMKVTLNDDDAGPAGTLQLTASSASVSESGNSIELKVSRTGGSSGSIGVSYATANGTAAAGSDYVSTSGTLLWSHGETADKSIFIPILDDANIDAAETFTLSLSNVTGSATLGNTNSATITINDDDLPGTLQFASANDAASEGSGTLVVSVMRTGGSAGAASVQVATSSGSATSGSDFTGVTTTLNWASGDAATKTINIPLLDDALVEGAETFSVALSNASGATLGNPSTETITLIDDEQPPAGTIQFSAASYSGNENGGSILITVTRSGGNNGPAGVQYATSSGSATSGTDFGSVSGTLTWASGVDGGRTFSIPVVDDSAFEGAESFSILLGNVTGAVLGAPSNATVTISDDDAPAAGSLQLSAVSFQVLENAGSLSVTVTRNGGSGGSASVQYATSSGTATAGLDFTGVSGTLNWADGDAAAKTFNIPILDDASAESPESFNVALSNASGASLGAPAIATVTIQSEDVAPSGTVQFAAVSATVAENGGSVTVTVTRTGGSNGAADVQIATADGVAKAGQDYVAGSAALHWNDGDSMPKTFTVNILNDSVIEGEPEAFTISLSNITGASFGNPTSMSVAINDDDVPNAGTLQFASASTSVAENGGSVIVTVTRAGGSDGAADVQIATADGVAKAGQDYVAKSASLHWNDGDSAPKTFTMNITDDASVEASEAFSVVLSNAAVASLGNPTSMSVTINDNDVAPAGTLQFSAATASASEADAAIALTVTRIGGSSGIATVKYATANGTAGASDYAS